MGDFLSLFAFGESLVVHTTVTKSEHWIQSDNCIEGFFVVFSLFKTVIVFIYQIMNSY